MDGKTIKVKLPVILQWLLRWRFRIALFAVTLLGLGLRVLNIGHLGLFGDEGATFVAARAIVRRGVPILENGLWVSRGLDYVYIVSPFLYLFGENEFALRLPGAIVGTLTIIMSYRLCKSLFRRQGVALIAAAILAFHPWSIEFSRTARMYVLFQFWTVVLLYCFYWGFVQESKRHQWCFILVAVISTIDHVEAISLLLLFSYLPLVKPWKRWWSPGYLLTCAVAVALPVGYFLLRPRIFYGISLVRPPNTGVGANEDIASKIPLLTQGSLGSPGTWKTFSAIAGPVIFGVLVLGSAVLLLFVARTIRRRERVDWLLPAGYLYWSLFALLVFFSLVQKGVSADTPLADAREALPRHLYHVFPLAVYAYSFTAVYLMESAFRLLKGRTRLGTVARTVVLTVLSSVSVLAVVSPKELPQLVFRTYRDPIPDRAFLGTTVRNALSPMPNYDYRPDFKTTSLYVRERYREGDAVLVMRGPPIHAFYLGDRVTHRIAQVGGAQAFVDSQGTVRDLQVDIPWIFSVQSILDVMAQHERVWIIHAYRSFIAQTVKRWLQAQSGHLVYQGEDGKSKVYLFDEAVTRLYDNRNWNLFYALQDVQLMAWGPDSRTLELQLNREQVWDHDGHLILGPSDLPIGDITFIDQLQFHPFSDEASTVVHIPIQNNRHAHIETSYGLPATALAAGSNGVEYSILISSDGGRSWRFLLQEEVQQASWRVRKIDIRPYQNQDLALRLIADPKGEFDYDWLQITLRLLPDD